MKSTDFSRGKVWQNIVAQSIPLILAQMELPSFPSPEARGRKTGRRKYWQIPFPSCWAYPLCGPHMGVSGAALATVLSQMVSCVWVL